MQLAGNFIVLKTSQHFGQAGHSRSVFQVADVGLHGTHQARRILRAGFSEHALDCFDFNRVADRRAGAVGFEVGELAAERLQPEPAPRG